MSPPPTSPLDLAGTALPDAQLSGWEAAGADLRRADLSGANLRHATLSGATLHGARMRGADLTGARGDGVSARDCDLEAVRLDDASLANADLTGAILFESSVRGAHLQGASLRGVDLRGADLRGADLRGVDLSRADVRGAQLDDALLDGVRTRALRFDADRVPPELLEHLLAGGARPPRNLFEAATTRLGPVVGRVGRASGRWMTATVRRQWVSARQLWSNVSNEGTRQLGEARDLRARMRDQRQADRRRIAAVAAARRERLRRDAGRSGAAEAEAERTRQDAGYRIIAGDRRKARPPTLTTGTAKPTKRTPRQARPLRAAETRAIQAHVAANEARARDEARARLEEQAARREEARRRAEEARQQAAEARRAAEEQREAEQRRLEAEQRRQEEDARLRAEEADRLLAEEARQQEEARQRAEEAERRRVEEQRLEQEAEERRVAEAEALRLQVLAEHAQRDGDLHTRQAEERRRAQAEAERRAVEQREEARSEQRRAAEAAQLVEDERAAIEQARLREAAERETADRELRERTAARRADAAHRKEAERLSTLRTVEAADAARMAALEEARREAARAAAVEAEAQARRAAAEQRARDEQLEREAARARQEREAAEQRAREAHARTIAAQQAEDDARARLGSLQARRKALAKQRAVAAQVAAKEAAEQQRIHAEQQAPSPAPGSAPNDPPGSFPPSLVDTDRTDARARFEALQRRSRSAREEAAATAPLRNRPPLAADSPAPPVDTAAAAAEQSASRTERVADTTAMSDARPGPLRQLLRLLPGGRSGADVPDGPGLHLAGSDLRGRRLGARTWPDTDLSGALLDTARLDGADLSRANLSAASMDASRLARAVLDGAVLEDASLEGARLRDASLVGARAARAHFVDADLRGTDLTGADLTGADLTGADLRRATLDGAILTGADLTAARLSDLVLAGVDLTDAELDQADLAGVDWSGAEVRGARLAGALGISGRDREALARAGAIARDESLDRLVGRVASRQVRAAVAVLVLGVGTYLGARYIAEQNPAPDVLEAKAEELRTDDPLAAAEVYADLAASSQRLSDRVGYLLEAGDLADQAGAFDVAGTHFAAALEEAGEDAGLSTDVRLRAAASLATRERWDELVAMIDPVLASGGQPADLRARAMLLSLDAARGQDRDAEVVERELFAIHAESPETEADLRLALAEMLSARGSLDAALGHLDRVATLDLARDQIARALDARARILDREGRLDDAARAYTELEAFAEPGSHTAQSARLSLADLRHRQGDAETAQTLIQALLGPETDDRIRARALMVSGRLHEQVGALDKARDAWQAALAMDGVEPETIEEARMSLARLLLASGDEDAIQAALADLPPEARESILVHARLGEARRFLDAGQPDQALEVYEALVANEDAERSMRRAARAGQAECLAALGEINEAVRIWREQLADDPTAEERMWLELALAHGLMQGGELDEAGSAFTSLAASTVPDIRYQGILGQADLARLRGETQRARSLYQSVVDRSPDAAFRVRALQELADLASEAGRSEDAREAWRTLLATVPAGDPVAVDARTALMVDLTDQGRIDEALTMCRQAEASAPDPERRQRVALACAELLEQSGETTEAATAYTSLLADNTPLELRMDAALGASRVLLESGDAPAAVSALEAVLADVEAEAQRLPLLGALLPALEATEDSLRADAVRAERTEIARRRPEAAGPILAQAAQQAREAGQIDKAVALFEEVTELPVPAATKTAVMLELADTLAEDGQHGAALTWFETILGSAEPDSPDAAAARLGAGRALLSSGDPEGAVERLQPSGDESVAVARTRLELLARAQTAALAFDDALETWDELVEIAGDDAGTRSSALRGRGDVLFGTDRFDEARDAYDAAMAAAPDAGTRGWSAIGKADALAALGEAEAALSLFRAHRAAEDPEVSAQARIREAQLHLGSEAWEDALSAVEPLDATDLGPGWDATLTETRSAAKVGLGDLQAARDAWSALEGRWPEAEEARLPAWLGLADLAASIGNTDEALALAKRALNGTDDPGYRARAEEILASNRP